MPEGTGTLLDNMLVVWGRELGNTNHAMQPHPIVLAGGAQGALRTGRFIDVKGEPHAKLLVSIMQMMSVTTTTIENIDADSAAHQARLTFATRSLVRSAFVRKDRLTDGSGELLRRGLIRCQHSTHRTEERQRLLELRIQDFLRCYLSADHATGVGISLSAPERSGRKHLQRDEGLAHSACQRFP